MWSAHKKGQRNPGKIKNQIGKFGWQTHHKCQHSPTKSPTFNAGAWKVSRIPNPQLMPMSTSCAQSSQGWLWLASFVSKSSASTCDHTPSVSRIKPHCSVPLCIVLHRPASKSSESSMMWFLCLACFGHFGSLRLLSAVLGHFCAALVTFFGPLLALLATFGRFGCFFLVILGFFWSFWVAFAHFWLIFLVLVHFWPHLPFAITFFFASFGPFCPFWPKATQKKWPKKLLLAISGQKQQWPKVANRSQKWSAVSKKKKDQKWLNIGHKWSEWLKTSGNADRHQNPHLASERITSPCFIKSAWLSGTVPTFPDGLQPANWGKELWLPPEQFRYEGGGRKAVTLKKYKRQNVKKKMPKTQNQKNQNKS